MDSGPPDANVRIRQVWERLVHVVGQLPRGARMGTAGVLPAWLAVSERLTGPGGSAMLRQPWTGSPFGGRQGRQAASPTTSM